MIAAQAQRQDAAGIELAVFHQNAFLGSTYGEDGDFGVVDDGGGEHAAVAAHVGDRERAAEEPLACNGPGSALIGELLDGVGEPDDAEPVRAADDGHHQTMVGVHGAAEVDDVLDQDLLLVVVHVGVHCRVLAQGLAHGGHDQRQEAQLATDDRAVFAALAVQRRDIRLIDHGEVDGGLDGPLQGLGDSAAHAAEGNPLCDSVGGDGDRSDGRRRGCLGNGGRGASAGVGLDIARRDPAAAPGPAHLVDVDAELLGHPPHRRRGQGLRGCAAVRLGVLAASESLRHGHRPGD